MLVITVYTEGSATAGTKDGGAGVILTCGDPGDPTIFNRSQLRGAALTSSFAEEATAMQLALEWATRQPPRALTLQRQSIDTQGN